MGFGLHFGWAIEGSIGSEYKIDASYLSPNVYIYFYKYIYLYNIFYSKIK